MSHSLKLALILATLFVARLAHAQSTDALPPIGAGDLPHPPPPTVPADDDTPVEPPSPPFGAQGQFMITGSSSAGVSLETFDGSQARYLNASFSPGIDYFFVRNVAVGLDLSVSASDVQGYGADSSLVETRSTGLSCGVRFGVNVPLGTLLSIFPRLTTSFESVRREEHLVSGQSLSIAGSASGYPSTTQTGPSINLFVPLLLHPRPQFFVGAGPHFFHDFASVQGGPNIGGQQTSVGIGAVVGGSWGGSSPVSPALGPEEAPAYSRRSFGEVGEIVLDGEIDGTVNSTTYQGTPSSSLSVGLEPSFDYFVRDRLSFGIAPWLTYSQSTGVDAATGALVSYRRSVAGLEPRVGLNVPIAPWLSWYPRAGLVFGGDAYDETSAGSENKSSGAFVAFHLYAPFLVHPGPHVFAGFGPSLYGELTHTVTFPSGASVQNRATTVGLGLVVGGWI